MNRPFVAAYESPPVVLIEDIAIAAICFRPALRAYGNGFVGTRTPEGGTSTRRNRKEQSTGSRFVSRAARRLFPGPARPCLSPLLAFEDGPRSPTVWSGPVPSEPDRPSVRPSIRPSTDPGMSFVSVRQTALGHHDVRTILIDAALPAPECDHDEVARADPNRPQSLSARTLLYARARPKVVREASRSHRLRLLWELWPRETVRSDAGMASPKTRCAASSPLIIRALACSNFSVFSPSRLRSRSSAI